MKHLQVAYDPLQRDTRSPLVYPLIGLLAGLPIGSQLCHTSPLPWAVAAVIFSTAAAVYSCRNAAHSPVGATLLLMASLLFSVGYGILRMEPLPDGELRPPREARMTIRIERLFGSTSPNRISGIATVREAPAFAAEAVGREVFFSARVRPGMDATSILPSCELLLTGVWVRIDPQEPSEFEQFLLRQRIFWTLSRCRIHVIAEQPHWWRKMAAWLFVKMQDALTAGTDTSSCDAADVLQGIMLGNKNALDDDLRHELALTGVMHLFAVSGLHIAIISKTILAGLLLCGLSMRLRQVCATTAVAIFIVAIGLPPAAIRAGLFLLCFAAATLLRRNPAHSNALAAAAIMVLLWDPVQLWHPGFQLSYSVVCGIFLYSLPLQRLLHLRFDTNQIYPFFALQWRIRNFFIRRLINYGTLSAGATFSSAALIAGYFGTYSVGSIPLNMVVVPIADPVVRLGTVSIVTGFIPGLLPLTEILNTISFHLIHLIMWIIRQSAKVPLIFSQGPAPSNGFILLIQTTCLLTLFVMTPILRRTYSLLPFAIPPAVVAIPLMIARFSGG